MSQNGIRQRILNLLQSSMKPQRVDTIVQFQSGNPNQNPQDNFNVGGINGVKCPRSSRFKSRTKTKKKVRKKVSTRGRPASGGQKAWINFVRDTMEAKNVSYKEALKIASPIWRKLCPEEKKLFI